MLKQTLTDLAFPLLNLVCGPLGSCATVLTYHSISDAPSRYALPPHRFKRQMAYLKRNGFKVIFLSELIARVREQKDFSNCVALTFDDGYQDNLTQALPVVVEHGFPMTLFMITGLMGRCFTNSDDADFEILDKAGLREMDASGKVEIMPHTRNHVELDQVEDDEAVEEVVGARGDLEDLLGKPADILSYPKGRHSQAVEDFLRRERWRGAVCVNRGLVHADADPFRMPRNSIRRGTWFSEFKGKVSSSVDQFAQLRARLPG